MTVRASSVSRYLRGRGIATVSPEGLVQGIRVQQRGSMVTVDVAPARLAELVADTLRQRWTVEPNPHDPAILTVTPAN